MKQGADSVLGTALIASLFFTGPIAGGFLAAGGGWYFYRSGERLWNRGEHGRSLSLFDREARAEWLTLLGSGAGSLAMIGRFARFLPNSRATRGFIAFGDSAAPKATMAGSLTITDAGVNLTNSDLSHDEIVSELWRMGLGTTFLVSGRAPDLSASVQSARTIISDFRKGYRTGHNSPEKPNTWGGIQEDMPRVSCATSRTASGCHFASSGES